jgi:hypothetical protein
MKKQFLFLLFVSIIFSCQEKFSEKIEQSNILENLTFTVDTVVVDPGDDFLTISSEYQLKNLSSLSEDKRTLYLFNNKTHQLAEIDLDQLKLIRSIPFEKEGPNGVGEFVQSIQVLPANQFLFTNIQSTGIFGQNAKNLHSFRLNSSEFQGLSIDEPFNSELLMTLDKKWIFSLTGFFNEGAKDLIKLNAKEKTGSVIDLPELDAANNFVVMMNDRSMMMAPQTKIRNFNEILLITNEVTSSVYRYDILKDSMQLLTFQHQLVPNEKTGTLKNEVSSIEELFAEMEKSSAQISFHEFMWDEKRERFFRLGLKVINSNVNEISDLQKENSYQSEVYLFAYDSDLNLVGESLLESLSDFPTFYFFKDGKLWSYVNVNDELGFAVMDFKFLSQ